MQNDEVDVKRRRLLITAAGVMGGVGLGYVATPFVMSMVPSDKVKAAGAPVEVDISKLLPGEMMTVEWRGKPVWILNRTEQEISNLKTLDDQLRDPKSDVVAQQPNYAKNDTRAINPRYLVVIGICTHLGCSPTFRPDMAPSDLGPQWKGGFFCPCHGSRYDLAGRVYKGVPAPYNLAVPPYRYLSDTHLLIGADPEVV